MNKEQIEDIRRHSAVQSIANQNMTIPMEAMNSLYRYDRFFTKPPTVDEMTDEDKDQFFSFDKAIVSQLDYRDSNETWEMYHKECLFRFCPMNLDALALLELEQVWGWSTNTSFNIYKEHKPSDLIVPVWEVNVDIDGNPIQHMHLWRFKNHYSFLEGRKMMYQLEIMDRMGLRKKIGINRGNWIPKSFYNQTIEQSKSGEVPGYAPEMQISDNPVEE